ncbi:MAG: cytochrome-c oxidase, cbb3-type subunit II, partial [Calditrichaeota bacterium]|nr:cytochrome-c oxidase, cbb3-type subunit II [Calditrichota bacterium]
VFSLMLIAPSWGGMLNGLLTLRGAWDRVRQDPILKFMVVAVTAYGMATFEGPMLSIKSVNALSHFTDWTIAHVHIGALGWNGFLTFGILYWLIPRIYNTKLHSVGMANFHFWIGTLGILGYAIPMYIAGITQGLMWKQFTAEGFLQYPIFLETVTQIIPMYMLRAIGGILYLVGTLVGVFNLILTVRKGTLTAEEPAQAPALVAEESDDHDVKNVYGHRWLESRPLQFTILTVIAVAIGGIIEFVPTFLVQSNVPTIASVKPYTPLELEGRDIYIREGCNTCHSQQIRPFRNETVRYGDYSKPGEFVYDHPFLWGSKRIGPDLHRVGGKYNHLWHLNHMVNPRSMSPGSIMPPYPWLTTQTVDKTLTPAKIQVMQTMGVPYPQGYENYAQQDYETQAQQIFQDLGVTSIMINETTGETAELSPDNEIIALIAYLQRLGTDLKAESTARSGETADPTSN